MAGTYQEKSQQCSSVSVHNGPLSLNFIGIDERFRVLSEVFCEGCIRKDGQSGFWLKAGAGCGRPCRMRTTRDDEAGVMLKPERGASTGGGGALLPELLSPRMPRRGRRGERHLGRGIP